MSPHNDSRRSCQNEAPKLTSSVNRTIPIRRMISPQRWPPGVPRTNPVWPDLIAMREAPIEPRTTLMESAGACRPAAVGARSLLEVGCGNGLFLGLAAEYWSKVVGLDWARSPMLDEVLHEHPNVRFVQQGIEKFGPDARFDLVVSADFFEHLAPVVLPVVIRKLNACGRAGYRKIACYDDAHSHLSILDPQRWLEVFAQSAPNRGY